MQTGVQSTDYTDYTDSGFGLIRRLTQIPQITRHKYGVAPSEMILRASVGFRLLTTRYSLLTCASVTASEAVLPSVLISTLVFAPSSRLTR
jgi:hypothetical protein